VALAGADRHDRGTGARWVLHCCHDLAILLWFIRADSKKRLNSTIYKITFDLQSRGSKPYSGSAVTSAV
jgi:hypothetical protein